MKYSDDKKAEWALESHIRDYVFAMGTVRYAAQKLDKIIVATKIRLVQEKFDITEHGISGDFHIDCNTRYMPEKLHITVTDEIYLVLPLGVGRGGHPKDKRTSCQDWEEAVEAIEQWKLAVYNRKKFR